MARRDRKGQIWRGYRRPVLRDGVFWFAALVGVAGVVVQSPLADWEGGTADWVVLVLEVGLTFAAAFVVVGVVAATIRGVGEGWRSAEQERAAPPAAQGPAPGPRPGPQATPAPADRPAPAVALEKKVRVLGRAVGAARRTYKQYDGSPPDPP